MLRLFLTFTPHVGSRPCGALRTAWHDLFVPHHINPKPLVIGAGEGTTGTRTISALVSKSTDQPVAHYAKEYRQGKPKLDPRYVAMRTTLERLHPHERDAFDYDLFQDYGGVFDDPIPFYLPYLVVTYPNARVILSVRNATDWVRSRQKHAASYLPLAGATSDVYTLRQNAVLTGKAHPNPNNQLSVVMYELQNTLVRCLVPPSQLLEVNLFEEETKDVEARIAAFLK